MGHSCVLIKVGLSFAQVAEQQTASSALSGRFRKQEEEGKNNKDSIKAAIEENQSGY